MRRRAAAVLLAGLVALTACTAPYDDDGGPGGLSAVPVKRDPRPVVVDTDLGRDDLAAIAVLVRHPEVEVVGFTIATTGLVGCADGRRVLGALLALVGVAPVTTACGRDDAGPDGRAFPAPWRRQAAGGFGLTGGAPLPQAPVPAERLVAALTSSYPRLELVALGPLTNVAALRAAHPDEYARLRAVHVMAGSRSGPAVAGAVEWNAAADPSALREVLSDDGVAPPLTLVPADAVPQGTPPALAGAGLGQVAEGLDTWWDLAAAAAFLDASADLAAERGAWSVAPDGRLSRAGDGRVRLVNQVPADVVDELCRTSLA